MLSTIGVALWDLLCFAIAFGPLLMLFWFWDRQDTLWIEEHRRQRLPDPKLSGREKAWRWFAGLGVFFAFGMLGQLLWQAAPAIEASLR